MPSPTGSSHNVHKSQAKLRNRPRHRVPYRFRTLFKTSHHKTQEPASTLRALPIQNTLQNMQKQSKPRRSHRPAHNSFTGQGAAHHAVSTTHATPAMMPLTMPSSKPSKTHKKHHQTHLNVHQRSPPSFTHKTCNKKTIYTVKIK